MSDNLKTQRPNSELDLDRAEIEIDLAQSSRGIDNNHDDRSDTDPAHDHVGNNDSAENNLTENNLTKGNQDAIEQLDDTDVVSARGASTDHHDRERAEDQVGLAMFELTLQQVRKREHERQAAKSIWLSHHWPDDYHTKCVKIGRRHICRRCAALYPLGFLVAILSVVGLPLWPNTLDPALIWILCIPASAAFVGEAIGLFNYSPRWQVGTTLIAAAAYGKALGYELQDRWSPEFWWPIAIFGGLWFLASVFNAKTAPRLPVGPLQAKPWPQEPKKPN